MKRNLTIACLHGVMVLLGASLVSLLPFERKDRDAGGAVAGADPCEEFPEELKTADYRGIIEASAEMPMLRQERTMLLDELLGGWARNDPQKLLPWLEQQDWLPRSRWPDLSGLCAQSPEKVFEQIALTGDESLFRELLEVDPTVASELGERAGLKIPSYALSAARVETRSGGAFEGNDARESASRYARAYRFAEVAGIWRKFPKVVSVSEIGWAVSDMPSRRGCPGVAELLPEGPRPGDFRHPLESLAFLNGLQGRYLPAGSLQDWRELLEYGMDFKTRDEDLAAVKAVATGDRSRENLEAVAAVWSQRAAAPAEVADLADAGFRDLCLREMLRQARVPRANGETADEARRRLWSLIEDPQMRLELEPTAEK